jgi:hypothetical protein
MTGNMDIEKLKKDDPVARVKYVTVFNIAGRRLRESSAKRFN